MPAHHVLFTDDKLLEFQPPLYPNGATRACIHEDHGASCMLRRMDNAENKYVPGGTYRESWVVLPNWKALGNKGLYGFYAKVITSGEETPDVFGGSVSYQLSNDNGVTWMYHDGLGWVVTTTGWNTSAQVDFNINTFALTAEKQIRIKVKLTPGAGGKSTPLLKWITIFAELDYNFQDDITRSVKHWLERYVWIDAHYFTQFPQPTVGGTGGGPCPLTTASSSTIMISDKKWDELSGPAEVYNITTDPGRTTNLFAGFVPGGITLTSPQVGFLEAHFFARPAVYVGAEEFMEIAKIPSIVVLLGNVKERRDLRLGSREVDYAKERMKAMIHLRRVWFDAEVRISCQSDLKHEATIMSDAVNKALTYHRYVTSEQTGQWMPIPYSTPITPAHRVAQGLFVREYVCTLYGKAWLRTDVSVEEDLVREPVILLHPSTNSTVLEKMP